MKMYLFWMKRLQIFQLLVMLPRSLLLVKEGNLDILALLDRSKVRTDRGTSYPFTQRSMFCTHRGRGISCHLPKAQAAIVEWWR